jgi:hypothetical protein
MKLALSLAISSAISIFLIIELTNYNATRFYVYNATRFKVRKQINFSPLF